jgi:lipoprotein-anchoring transpeptidase ErfK/SrfK
MLNYTESLSALRGLAAQISAQSNWGKTVRRLSRTTMAWACVGIIVVGGGVAGGVLATSGTGASHAGSGQLARHDTTAAPAPLRLLSVSPVGGTTGVIGGEDITVTFSKPLPAGAPMPAVSPAIAGTWQRDGDTAVFTPSTGFAADTHVTVSVPQADGTLRSGYKSSFTTAGYSTLRLQQLLAQLGYLPMSWHPEAGAAIDNSSAAAQLAAAYSPPPGTFTFQRGYPSGLYSFWQEGSANLLDRGAITGFEADHGFTPNGVASPAVWAALLRAAAAGDDNKHGYSYAIANQGSPETLTIWHNGRDAFSSLTNTGIASDPTPVGTFPVYLKLPYQVMEGTNPDGSFYADPVQWVSYFSGGSAVHYIARGSYGYPQSLGCVELPYSAAQEAYPILPYGTLVTVTP